MLQQIVYRKATIGKKLQFCSNWDLQEWVCFAEKLHRDGSVFGEIGDIFHWIGKCAVVLFFL